MQKTQSCASRSVHMCSEQSAQDLFLYDWEAAAQEREANASRHNLTYLRTTMCTPWQASQSREESSLRVIYASRAGAFFLCARCSSLIFYLRRSQPPRHVDAACGCIIKTNVAALLEKLKTEESCLKINNASELWEKSPCKCGVLIFTLSNSS